MQLIQLAYFHVFIFICKNETAKNLLIIRAVVFDIIYYYINACLHVEINIRETLSSLDSFSFHVVLNLHSCQKISKMSK